MPIFAFTWFENGLICVQIDSWMSFFSLVSLPLSLFVQRSYLLYESQFKFLNFIEKFFGKWIN